MGAGDGLLISAGIVAEVLIVTGRRNAGDCFAYEVAKEHGCRLLYVGSDFAKTDIEGIV